MLIFKPGNHACRLLGRFGGVDVDVVVPVDLVPALVVGNESRLYVVPDLDIANQMHILVRDALFSELLLFGHTLKRNWILHF